MKIFLKYIMKSIFEKKGRFLLLIIAISLSTGLLTASCGTVEIGLNALTRPARESMESKDINIITKGEESFFSGDDIKEEGIKNIVKEININGTLSNEDDEEPSNVSMRGRDVKDISSYNLIEGTLEHFQDKECIISKRTSEDFNLSSGDTLDVVLAGKKETLKVKGVSGNEGVFYTDTKSYFTVIVPYEFLGDALNVNGKYNLVMADKDEDSIKESIDTFNDNNDNYKAEKLIDEDMLKKETASFTQVLYYMLAIVALMSAIIIYSSFKLIITERIPVIGTFLSQGAEKKTIERILYLESIIYGVIGAVFGSILGTGGLVIISRIASPLREYGIYEPVNIKIKFIIAGVVFAIVLSFFSSLIPIRRIRKLQVKEVILNTIDESAEIGVKKFIFGAVLLGICTVMSFSNIDIIKKLSILFILLTFVGMILIYPKIVDVITGVLYKIFRGRSKTVILALNNLRTSKVLIGNITLILISIMAVFMISSLGYSIEKYVTDCYYGINYDVEIQGISTMKDTDTPVSDEIIKKIKDTEGYEEDSLNPQLMLEGSFKDKDCNFKINGIEPKAYEKSLEYFELDKEPSKSVYKHLLDGEDGILISNIISKNTGIEEGDNVKLTVQNVEREVKVIGVMDMKLYCNGYFVMANKSFIEDTFNIKGYDYITFNTENDPSEFVDSIKDMKKDYGVTMSTREEDLKQNNENNKMTIYILNIFSYMAMIIAALGVISNISIGFIQRKRSLAVLSSVGMSKGNRNKMLISESLFTVIWAGLFSIPGTMLTVRFLSMVLNNMDFAIKVNVDYSIMPLYVVSAIIIVLIATMPVIFKSRKLSIVNELKYE